MNSDNECYNLLSFFFTPLNLLKKQFSTPKCFWHILNMSDIIGSDGEPIARVLQKGICYL